MNPVGEVSAGTALTEPVSTATVSPAAARPVLATLADGTPIYADESPVASTGDGETIAGGADLTPAHVRPSSPYTLPELVDIVEESVVRIEVENETGVGSGFVATRDGSIMTNYHVIEGASSATIFFVNGDKADVTGVYYANADLDLAIIKADVGDRKLRSLPVAPSLPRKGEGVASFGAPRGLSFTTSEGIVSGLRNAEELDQAAGTFIQTTSAISGGNSGGPLTNMFGEVVGVNTFKRTDGESLNFAISCEDVRQALRDRGDKVIALNPENVPVKVAGGYGSAVNLAGTEKARALLSQIREVVLMQLPFTWDSSGRITDYVMRNVEVTVEEKLKWKVVTRASQLKGSTAVMVIAMYFTRSDKKSKTTVNELILHTVILTRDVTEDGKEIKAIIWDEKASAGTIAIDALRRGILPRTMEAGIRDYFNQLVVSYRKTIRETTK